MRHSGKARRRVIAALLRARRNAAGADAAALDCHPPLAAPL